MDRRNLHNPEMTERRQNLLQLLVREYVNTGKPVGSNTLVSRYNAPISSATIRNEMVALEQMGYVAQPHTSGGRVPTDQGYRYYVHHLMPNRSLAQSDQVMIRHQFRQVEAQLDSMVEFAASVLSSTSGMASIVTAPKTHVARLRHFELISLQPRLALLILVTQESAVRQMMLHLPEEAEQPLLSALADNRVAQLRGLSSREIEPFVRGDPIGRHGAARREHQAELHENLATGVRGAERRRLQRTDIQIPHLPSPLCGRRCGHGEISRSP